MDDQSEQAQVGDDVATAAAEIEELYEVPVGRPTQDVTNWIWRVIVLTFSVVLVATTVGFIAAVFAGAEDIQLLLTIVTTIAGLLAGFVTGRSSSQ